ncbi:acyl-CoA dehydrogenase [Microbispora sp. SCL1-1]|uniref:acyl-CoA dehydrogenase family protein n=1 Tax=unclassified Microbispora TaxID=2614687 RepID=UPI0011583E2C|nr:MULTISPECIES: acyl-CoA dehydrogenase family protein [unclassified Microbispora]NJP23802.1 acyl-CoA/acyl-ACP dehydrogenase [Microbispora sp. CL1-1]TQS15336.1 acyl-CoA dehydrogenase [Microbispora sp. SCL1-1]
MTLLYTEVEEELRAAVRDLLTDTCPPSAVLDRAGSAAAGGTPYDAELWKALARDIGVAGLLVPEELGGAGASAREAAVVLEELGRAVAPVPFLSSAVLATQALLVAGGEVAGELLGRLATGEATAALAVSFAASPYAPPAPVASLGEDGTVTGTVTGVIGAEAADVLLVPVRLAQGVGLCAVETSPTVQGSAEEAVRVTTVTSLDLTRPIATVEFASAPARIVARAEGLELPWVWEALARGAGLLASEQLGVAEWCLTTTVAYVKERRQFARPVGSFQAVKHRLADLWLEVVGARAAARNAAALLAEAPAAGPLGDEAAVAVAVAQAHCGAVAVHAAEECVQLHGGIGMTWEHPAHLYLKRAKADQIGLGTPGDHRDALAGPADLPAPM